MEEDKLKGYFEAISRLFAKLDQEKFIELNIGLYYRFHKKKKKINRNTRI